MSKIEFFDEQVLDMKNHAASNIKEKSQLDSAKEDEKEAEEKQIPPEERTIYTGIKIMGRWIYFERRLVENGAISMMIPKDFEPMSLETAKLKYPSEHRPTTILTDYTGAINIMFRLMEGSIADNEMEEYRNKVFEMMCRVNQGIKKIEQGVEESSGKHIAYVEFSNPTLDGKLYNLMFLFDVGGKPYMGNFNCPTKELKYWQPVMLEMMKSIEMGEE